MANDLRWHRLYHRADQAGREAAEAKVPTPMVVVGMQEERYHVPQGVCGFAWVNVRPGGSSFARWLKKRGYAHTSYDGGVDVWVSAYGQSMEKKEAYARGFAAVLRESGIEKAYSRSRMD